MSNYMRIDKCDSGNGPGVRVVFWFAGCAHHCLGCHNPETWDPTAGYTITDDTINEVLDALGKEYISGLTLSGGDPLFLGNRDMCDKLVSACKKAYPNKSIWLWTGYLWENIKNLPVIKNIDVLVDGPFILKDRDIRLKYCGSPNQRVIDVQKTLKENTIILYE